MKNNIPIVAYNSTAIPWTLGDSGILVNKKDHYFIAELINVLIQDVDFQKKIIKKQVERLSFFDNNKTGKKILNIIEYLINT